MDIFVRTLEFTLPVIATIFAGLFMAGFLSELGILSRISSFARPLVVIANLPEVCASSFVLSLGSTVAANGMIARFWKDGLVEDREVFLCAMINSIPAYIREIFTYQIPVVIPALGLAAGGIYGMIFMVTAAVKILLVIILGRTMLSSRTYRLQDLQPKIRPGVGEAAFRSLKGLARIFTRMAVVYFSVTLLVFSMNDRGLFNVLAIIPMAELFGVPSESIVPLASYVASPTLGLSMLGPMIHSGSLSSIQALIVLMVGSMFMLPVFALRSMVPNYTALFGARLGLAVVAFSTGISIVVRLVFLVVFLRIA
jgi:hypothetical protein